MSQILNIEEYRKKYLRYFQEFDRVSKREYPELNYGSDKPNGTASSLESVIAYANYIKQDKDIFLHSILNAGSGLSSIMLRDIFPYVTDVDTNLYYSKLISDVCLNLHTPNKNFLHGISQVSKSKFDHIYYDYGSIERLPYLGMAIDMAKISLYIDDTDCRDECMPYRNHVIELCKAMNLKWFDCLDAKDSSGRWGIIIEK